MKTTITFEIDVDTRSSLESITDQYLAQLWNIAQANPGKHAEREAGELVRLIGTEIIRRWLTCQRPELYAHQAGSFEWYSLCALGAKFIDGKWQIPTTPDEVAP